MTPHDRRMELRWGFAVTAAAVLAGLDMARGGMPFFRDRLYYFMPQYAACRAACAGGEVPLWNPYVNCGQPLLATWQQGLFSPLSLPFLLFPWSAAWTWFWPSALGVAAAGMFAFARRAGLPPAGAGIAALLYALSGPLRTFGEWPNIVASLALLPALLAAVAATVAGRRGAGPAVAVTAALQLLCGQPRQVLIAAVVTAGWAVAARGTRRVWTGLLGAGLLAAAIAAAQLGPTTELYLGSDRAEAGIPADTVTESFLRGPDALTVLGGRMLGTEEQSSGPGRLLMPRLTLGWCGLLLIGLGLTAPGRIRRYAALTVPIAFLLAVNGPHVGAVMRLAGAHDPVLRYFGHFALAAWPALALLAGAGAARLLAGAPGAGWVALAAGAAGVFWWTPWSDAALRAIADPGAGWRTLRLTAVRIDAWSGAVAAAIAAGAAAIARGPRGRPAVAAGLLAAALATDLWWLSRHHEAKAPAGLFTPGPLADRLAASGDRVFIPGWGGVAILGPGSSANVQSVYAARARGLSPNVGLPVGVRNAQGYEPLAPAAGWWLFGAWNGRCDSVRDGLRAAGVRWIVGPVDGDTAPHGWTLRRRVSGRWGLFESPDPVPPIRVVDDAAVARPWEGLADAPRAGVARILTSSWNTLDVSVTAARPGRLLTGWFNLPGWIARRGGDRVPLAPAGGLFQSLPVPAGGSAIRLVYAPASFALGLWLGALALAAALARAALQ